MVREMVAARHLMNCNVSPMPHLVLSRSVESRPRSISSTWEPVSGTNEIEVASVMSMYAIVPASITSQRGFGYAASTTVRTRALK